MSKLHDLSKLGQSIWYDYIRRSFITSGELKSLVDGGLRGVTSNPSIFEKAIAGSADYDKTLRELVAQNKSINEIYEALVSQDISRAADILRPVYDGTKGLDGYMSLEVNPKLAHDTKGTVAEAKRLFAALNRPNLMIKVPATSAGIPAITELIGAGINVNVTLIFALENYKAVAEAYISGLEKLAASGGDLHKVASVASFFVSRVDTAVDAELAAKGNETLQGKIAIANSKVAYSISKEIFSGGRWQKLAKAGARMQRLLWASTGAKNPSYPDTLYLDQLIGADTVNTVPPATLNAFLDHGVVAATLEQSLDTAKTQLAQLADLGIDLKAITQKLQDDGVAAFAKSFESLMAGIEEKRKCLLANKKNYSASLGRYQAVVDRALANLRDNSLMSRIWKHDHTVWKSDPTEITNRLGWLHSPEVMMENIPEINAFVEAVRRDGYTHALLLGMGGSSLAPEVFRFTFGVKPGCLDLAVLDSTDPGAVLHHARRLDLKKTLFIVSTKSGGTVETFSLFKYFYNVVMKAVGKDKAGHHFIAITDPGSGLVNTAKEYKFRKTFFNDPNIGGRYSALSYFGLIPAALIGVEVAKLLDRAQTMACNNEGCNCPVAGDNTGAWLGAIMGEMAMAGRDKVTLFASPAISSFGAWAEQLIAESTGKENAGILPVAGEEPGPPQVYANDRLFVHLRLEGDNSNDAKIKALADAGHPVVQFDLKDTHDLGGEFFRWEMATTIAGWRLGINPFDQPNVESAKVLARKMVAEFQEKGKLPELTPTIQENGITSYADFSASSVKQALQNFLMQAQANEGKLRSYVALQAYVTPNAATDEALKSLATKIRDSRKLATTIGYGPRFLHSTGQLHKGDAGNGLFIQLTAAMPEDAPIPDKAGDDKSSITFGTLIMAQALGDRQALLDNKRKVIRFDLGNDVVGGLKKLAETI
jgi:transaldolase/glucose-6-phosphate isomerase